MSVKQLEEAIERGSVTEVQHLLDHGVDVNASLNGQTPLTLSIDNNRPDITKLLLENGLDPDEADECQSGSCHEWLYLMSFITQRGRTPLEYAVDKKQTEMVDMLVFLGVDINHRDRLGKTVFDQRLDQNMSNILHQKTVNRPVDIFSLKHLEDKCVGSIKVKCSSGRNLGDMSTFLLLKQFNLAENKSIPHLHDDELIWSDVYELRKDSNEALTVTFLLQDQPDRFSELLVKYGSHGESAKESNANIRHIDDEIHIEDPPEYIYIPGGLKRGANIIINGKTPIGYKAFAINLKFGNTGDSHIPFHFNPRREHGGHEVHMVVRNTKYRGGWGSEERDQPNFPFLEGSTFQVRMFADSDEFKVCVNGKDFINYRYRTDLNEILYLQLGRRAEYYDVTIQNPMAVAEISIGRSGWFYLYCRRKLDRLDVPAKGGRISSTMDPHLTLDVPPEAFKTPGDITIKTDIVDRADLLARGKLEEGISAVSSFIQMLHSSGKQPVKEITMTIPLSDEYTDNKEINILSHTGSESTEDKNDWEVENTPVDVQDRCASFPTKTLTIKVLLESNGDISTDKKKKHAADLYKGRKVVSVDFLACGKKMPQNHHDVVIECCKSKSSKFRIGDLHSQNYTLLKHSGMFLWEPGTRYGLQTVGNLTSLEDISRIQLVYHPGMICWQSMTLSRVHDGNDGSGSIAITDLERTTEEGDNSVITYLPLCLHDDVKSSQDPEEQRPEVTGTSGGYLHKSTAIGQTGHFSQNITSVEQFNVNLSLKQKERTILKQRSVKRSGPAARRSKKKLSWTEVIPGHSRQTSTRTEQGIRTPTVRAIENILCVIVVIVAIILWCIL